MLPNNELSLDHGTYVGVNLTPVSANNLFAWVRKMRIAAPIPAKSYCITLLLSPVGNFLPGRPPVINKIINNATVVFSIYRRKLVISFQSSYIRARRRELRSLELQAAQKRKIRLRPSNAPYVSYIILSEHIDYISVEQLQHYCDNFDVQLIMADEFYAGTKKWPETPHVETEAERKARALKIRNSIDRTEQIKVDKFVKSGDKYMLPDWMAEPVKPINTSAPTVQDEIELMARKLQNDRDVYFRNKM